MKNLISCCWYATFCLVVFPFMEHGITQMHSSFSNYMVFNLVNIYYGSIALDDMFSCQRLLCHAILLNKWSLLNRVFVCAHWILFLENILICFYIDENSNISYLYNLHLYAILSLFWLHVKLLYVLVWLLKSSAFIFVSVCKYNVRIVHRLIIYLLLNSTCAKYVNRW